MIIAQLPRRQNRFNLREPHLRPITLGQRHRPVQRHHRGRPVALQHIVQPDDFVPVRRIGRGRLGMHRSNRRLYGVGAIGLASQGVAHQRAAFFDTLTVPQAAVLLLEQHQIALGVCTRTLARRLQQHQRQQTKPLRVG
ncbi:hypothetical protein D3C80_1618330 [compost metagenome]